MSMWEERGQGTGCGTLAHASGRASSNCKYIVLEPLVGFACCVKITRESGTYLRKSLTTGALHIPPILPIRTAEPRTVLLIIPIHLPITMTIAVSRDGQVAKARQGRGLRLHLRRRDRLAV